LLNVSLKLSSLKLLFRSDSASHRSGLARDRAAAAADEPGGRQLIIGLLMPQPQQDADKENFAEGKI
jgi:hypothetical protein